MGELNSGLEECLPAQAASMEQLELGPEPCSLPPRGPTRLGHPGGTDSAAVASPSPQVPSPILDMKLSPKRVSPPSCLSLKQPRDRAQGAAGPKLSVWVHWPQGLHV